MCRQIDANQEFDITLEKKNIESKENDAPQRAAVDTRASVKPLPATPVLEYASPMPVEFRLSGPTKIILGCGLFVFVASMAAAYDWVE